MLVQEPYWFIFQDTGLQLELPGFYFSDTA